jgi:hypothetical protein
VLAGRAVDRKLARHGTERRPKRCPGAMESKGFQTLLHDSACFAEEKKKDSPERRGSALFLHKSTVYFRLLAGSHSLGDEIMLTALKGGRAMDFSGSRPESMFFINVDIYIRMSTHLYKYTHVHSISMSTSERLSQFNLKIHKVGH